MNLRDSYNKVKTPDELLKLMDNIKYGIYGNDNKVYINDGTKESNKIFQWACINQYGLANKDKVLKYGVGQCFDQTELERTWFREHNYEYKTIFIWFLFDYENTYPTHSYLIYKDNDKYCYFEHADEMNKGIYKFDSYIDAIKYQMNKHIEYTKKNGNIVDDEIIKHLHIYEYDEPKSNISFDEFIDHILESKEITNMVLGSEI